MTSSVSVIMTVFVLVISPRDFEVVEVAVVVSWSVEVEV